MTEEEKLPKERKRRPRGHGEGSIFYRRDRKQWVAQISLENGRTRQVYRKKREEAADALQEMLYEQKQGILATGAKQTLGQYLEFWLEKVQKPAIRINHYINTRTILDLHILPALGRVQLQQQRSRYSRSMLRSSVRENLLNDTPYSRNIA